MHYTYTMSPTESKQWCAGDTDARSATIHYANLRGADVKATRISIQTFDGREVSQVIVQLEEASK